VHYAASKAAIETLTLGLAREVAAEGIRVNCVSCGFIATEMHAAAGDAGRLTRAVAQVPLQRAGLPEEAARAMAEVPHRHRVSVQQWLVSCWAISLTTCRVRCVLPACRLRWCYERPLTVMRPISGDS